MASEAQVRANRLNARRSTGPRTAEGKAVVSQNAVKHGLLAREIVIKGEDPGEFEFYRDRMLGELTPVGEVESVLAERVVSLSWRLRRAERLQGRAIDALLTPEPPSPLAKLQKSLLAKAARQSPPEPEDPELVFGRAVARDFSRERVLDRLLVYERRIEHSLYRTMAELQRQRLLRELEGPGDSQEVSSLDSQVSSGEPALRTPNIELHTCPEPSCKTNPIRAGAGEGQVPCSTEVMDDSPQDRPGKTKPILTDGGLAGGPSASPREAARRASGELSGNGLFAPPTIVYS